VKLIKSSKANDDGLKQIYLILQQQQLPANLRSELAIAVLQSETLSLLDFIQFNLKPWQ